ncbi:MAG: tRNA (adenosine(37)-N6)-threonylcarbamoyltransferase complex ATPase subunit type 1 TsaE [Rubrimonas sp.]|uniref:tRNA (adenosine(37)-N6)-threonylcarbamoyltransferase complex ATPase subunit type 1 TsaE n=1 Tax=Rubrimonas sp. TaxID=2036015 RepID=UPI002FDE67A2
MGADPSPFAAADAAARLLPDAAATDRLGAALGRALRPGDAVLLEGPLGAGKSALARAAIAARLADCGRLEDIPSPTYTLVQCYETPEAALWHADLYRLSDPSEAAELGLAEALETGVCLIEWPDRLGPLAPRRALRLRLGFPDGGEGRLLAVRTEGDGWSAALAAIEGTR